MLVGHVQFTSSTGAYAVHRDVVPASEAPSDKINKTVTYRCLLTSY